MVLLDVEVSVVVVEVSLDAPPQVVPFTAKDVGMALVMLFHVPLKPMPDFATVTLEPLWVSVPSQIGRIRLQTIPNLTRTAVHGFIAASVEPGSRVRTDGFKSYLELDGYVHQRHVQTEQSEDEHVLPRMHRVIGLLQR
ncbi:transposase [Telmatobacter bradus]|uniref:transposase n=1 Tax=Telmatobacter bradus TaxID=474953 RepID=UPI003B42F97B